MKPVLLILVLATSALAAPSFEPILNYHEAVGIPKAALIKASEESRDFDGARIVGGSPAHLGQFPYMGGVIILLQSGFNSACGSSLVTNTRLITAAHCWFDGRQMAQQFTIVLGSVFLFSGGTRINTNQVVMHPNYDIATIANDIAVVTIPHVSFSHAIGPVSLPTGSSTFAGQMATAIGFGVTGPGIGITQNQFLNFVNLPVITNAVCQSFFGRYIIDSTLCTWGPTGQNICSSDSGGPLVIGNTLIGVTSFGTAVCGSNAPAGFARVTSFMSWILHHL